MNRLDTTRRVAVVKALVEGNSIRSTVRMTGRRQEHRRQAAGRTRRSVREYQDANLRNLTSKRVQCDEIWSFCGAKKEDQSTDQTIRERQPDAGDVWTWTAI